jgi:Effector-associated domain 1
MSTHPGRPADSEVPAELAKVFCGEHAALGLLEQIKFPPGRIPRFDASGNFWRSISRELAAGILPAGDGLSPLIRAAHELYPGNDVFSAWLGLDGAPSDGVGEPASNIALKSLTGAFAEKPQPNKGQPVRVTVSLEVPDADIAFTLLNALAELLNCASDDGRSKAWNG